MRQPPAPGSTAKVETFKKDCRDEKEREAAIDHVVLSASIVESSVYLIPHSPF